MRHRLRSKTKDDLDTNKPHQDAQTSADEILTCLGLVTDQQDSKQRRPISGTPAGTLADAQLMWVKHRTTQGRTSHPFAYRTHLAAQFAIDTAWKTGSAINVGVVHHFSLVVCSPKHKLLFAFVCFVKACDTYRRSKLLWYCLVHWAWTAWKSVYDFIEMCVAQAFTWSLGKPGKLAATLLLLHKMCMWCFCMHELHHFGNIPRDRLSLSDKCT